MASKGKRSKIRSFALIFEELGDMLTFPDLIKERDGLKIAAALRDGHEVVLREALAEKVPDTPAEEAEQIAAALDGIDSKTDPKRGGRPRKTPKKSVQRTTDAGVSLRAEQDASGWLIRIDGNRVDAELVETAMAELERLLGAPNET